MKKYSLLGIVGLLVIVIGVVARQISQNSPLSSSTNNTGVEALLAHLPITTDQLMLVSVTPGTQEIMLQTNPDLDRATFTEVLKTINYIVIAQASAPEGVYNAIFFEGREGFSPERIQSLGMLAEDTGYVAQQIAPQVRIYADEYSLPYFLQGDKQDNLAQTDAMQAVLKGFAQEKATVLFYSTPTADTATASPLAATFAQKLQFTALFATPTLETSQGKLIMQFSGTTLTRPTGSFSAKHAADISPETLLYLESRKLLDTFGLSADQFSMGLSLMLGQFAPGSASLVTTQQLSDLYSALNERLTLFLELASTPFGMGINLVIDDPDSFETLAALAPVWKMVVTGFLGATGALQEQTTADSRVLSMGLPSLLEGATGVASLGADLTFPILSLSHDEKSTTLSLLGPKNTPVTTPPSLTYTDESLLTFRYDPSVAAENTANPLLGELGGQFAQFGTGIILGQLSVDAQQQQLIATFESK